MYNSRRKHERPKPYGSQLLTDEENQRLFEVLGSNRISLFAGVAQLLRAVPGAPSWSRVNVGVALLIKDYIKRCYVISLYDVLNCQILWTQILYKNFRAQFYPNCPRLVAFEGETSLFGLNFSDYEEAMRFKEHLNKRYEQEQKSGHKEQRIAEDNMPMNIRAGANSQYPHPTTGITAAGTVPHFSSAPQEGIHFPSEHKKDKKRKDKKLMRPRKEDIGNPSDFRHLVHIGWEDQGLKPQVLEDNILDDTVKTVLRAAGQNPDDMPNHELEYAYKFIQEQLPQISAPISAGVPEDQIMPIHSSQNFEYSRNDRYNNRIYPEHSQKSTVQQDFRQQGLNSSSIGKNEAYNKNPPPRPPPPPVHSQSNHREHLSASNQFSTPQNSGFNCNGNKQNYPGVHSANNIQENVKSRNNRPPPPPIPSIPPHQTSSQMNYSHEKVNLNEPAKISQNAPPPPPPPLNLFAQAHSENSGEKEPQPNLSASSDHRTNLLQQIQQGSKLRKVDPPSSDKTPVPTNPPNLRDNMMSEIKQGTTLKRVDQAEVEARKSASNIQDLSGIAGALARALEQRRKNLISDDSSSDEEEGNNDSEWEEN